MDNPAEPCAREVLETVPVVMRFIREQVRKRRAGGLSLPQFRALAFLGQVHDASLSGAAEHLGLSLAAMSRLIHGLVVGGLARRRTVSTNRRQIALALTARGHAALEKMRGRIRLRLADSLKTLPAAEQENVQRAMRILRRVFDSRAAMPGGSPAPPETKKRG